MRPADLFARVAADMERRAVALARAHGETQLRARRGDGSHWRRAQLLWPGFTDRNS